MCWRRFGNGICLVDERARGLTSRVCVGTLLFSTWFFVFCVRVCCSARLGLCATYELRRMVDDISNGEHGVPAIAHS